MMGLCLSLKQDNTPFLPITHYPLTPPPILPVALSRPQLLGLRMQNLNYLGFL
jgi:hypothetical protein